MGYNDWENSNIDNTISPGERFLKALGRQFSYTPSPEEISRNVSGIVGLGGIKPAPPNVVNKPVGIGASGEWGGPIYNKDIGLVDEVPTRKPILPSPISRPRSTATTPQVLPQPDEENAFRNWYSGISSKTGLNPNPYDPNHFYDYKSAWKSGVTGPDETGHWPSQFKLEGHPRMVVDGVNTRTGIPMQPQGEVQGPPHLVPVYADQALGEINDRFNREKYGNIYTPKYGIPTQPGAYMENGDTAMAKVQDEYKRGVDYYNSAPPAIKSFMGPPQAMRAPISISLMKDGQPIQNQYMDMNPNVIPTSAERAGIFKESYGHELTSKAAVDAAKAHAAPGMAHIPIYQEHQNMLKEEGKKDRLLKVIEQARVGLNPLYQSTDWTKPDQVKALNNASTFIRNQTLKDMEVAGYTKQERDAVGIALTTPAAQPPTQPNVAIKAVPRVPTLAQVQKVMNDLGITEQEARKRMMGK